MTVASLGASRATTHRAAGVSVRRSDIVRVLTLAFLDVVSLFAAFLLAFLTRSAADKPLEHHVTVAGFIFRTAEVAPLWVLIFCVCGLYASRLKNRRISEITRIVVAVSGGVMLLIVSDYLSPSSPLFPGRAIPIWALIYGIGFVLLNRLIANAAMHLLFARGYGLHHVILVGTGDTALQVANEMSDPSRGYRIVAAVDPSRDGGSLIHLSASRIGEAEVPVYSSIEAAVATASRVDEIMQADMELGRDDIAQLISYANANHIAYRFVPDLFGIYTAASTVSSVGALPVMEMRLTALDGWGALGKRVFDVVGSALLLLLLSPAMLVLATALKVMDPSGPVMYKQQRVGKNGQVIHVHKFRSMLWKYSTGPERPFKTAQEAFIAMGREDLCAEFEENQKVVDDPRVSKLGDFLRRTSLDELPQLVDALTGSLSLVGPRPITTAELERYGDRVASFLALKPGITGLWQVSGRSEVAYHERVALDVQYVENWSPALDLSILFRTVKTVTARRGAY